MNLWALLLLPLLAGCGCASVPSHNELRQTALVLRFADGLCSGTAVGPHTLWTAKHCLTKGPITSVNGTPVAQGKVTELSKDRVSVIVSGITFQHIAKIGPAPVQGQRVRFFGNPEGNPSVYREGYIARAQTDGLVLVMPICHGDSGSGLLDDKGRVVGVVSAMTSKYGCTFGLSF